MTRAGRTTSTTSKTPPEFSALQRAVTDLHGQWKLYGQLFTTQEQVATLDSAASSAFSIFQESLYGGIVLAIGRLLDTRTRDTLTLERLPTLLRQRGKTALAAEARGRITALKKQCRILLTWRHKLLAHADIDVALWRVTLDGAAWNEIDGAVAAIRKLMKRVEAALRGRSIATVYEMIVLHGDGDDLIHALERAQAYRDDQRARRGLPPLRPSDVR